MITIDLLDLYASLTLDTKKYEMSLNTAEAQGKRASDNISSAMKNGAKSAADAAGTIGTSMAGGIKTVASGSISAAKSVASGVKSIVGSVTSATQSMIQGTISATSKVASAVANVGKIAAGVGAAGLGVATAATAKLGTEAFNAYGEYEQLAGGISTLFGENSAATQSLNAFADNAFQTVQMSANDYMSTVTDFSAKLLQEMIPEGAASMADKAMQQIADNSNKLGTDIERITDAYKGFAKGNFTMLDNLKLGYGGTAGEMARLINDANILPEFEATAENIKDVNFGDMINAIGVIQERLGMAGVSQEEALHTIQGSINMTKAAWQNLLTGFANPDADLDKLVSDVMTSLDAVQENALPAIERILDSAGEAVAKFAPNLRERASKLITGTAPTLIKAAASLMGTVGGVLIDTVPDLIDTAIDTATQFIDGADASGAVSSLLDFIQRIAGTVTQKLPRLVSNVGSVVIDTLPELIDIVATTVTDLIEGVDDNAVVTAVIDFATRITDTVTKTLPRIIAKGMALVRANRGQIRAGIANIVSQIVTTLTEMLSSGDVQELAATFTDIWLDIVEILAANAPTLIPVVFETITTIINTALQRIKDDPQGFVQTCVDIFAAVVSSLFGAAGSVITSIGSTVTSIFSSGFDGVDTSALGEQINTIFGNLFDGVTGLNPESVANFCVNAVTQLADGLAPAIETALPTITSFIASFVETFTNEDNTAKLAEAGNNLLNGICNGINAVVDNDDITTLKDSAVNAVAKFAEWVTDEETLQKVYDTGGKVIEKLGNGLDDNVETLIDAAGNAIGNLIKFLTSDYTLAKIFDAGIDIMAMLGRGMWNGLTDALSGIARHLAAGISDLTGNTEYAEELRNMSNKDANSLRLTDDWYIGKTYETFRGMEYTAGDLNYEEYMASLGKSVKSADRYKYEPALGKYIDQEKNEVVDYKVIVQVDGRVLGETDEQYLNRKQEAYGY